MKYIDRQLLKESRRGRVDRMKRLVARGANVNCTGKYGYCPLIEAANLGHADAVRFLLERGADASMLTSDKAPTLFFACVRGHAEVVELLLDAGANPNANRDSECVGLPGDSSGVSMLHIAINLRFARVVEALVRAGANTGFVCSGKDAPGVAIEIGDKEIINMVKRGVVRR